MADAGESPAAKRARHEPSASGLAQCRGYGKLILFGEHFVVYKVPALVGAVAAYTDCDCEFLEEPGLQVIDERPAVPHYKVKKADEAQEAIQLTLKHLNVDTTKRGVKLTFGGDLCAVSGIGASAAQVVALARAVGRALPLKMSEDEINAAGYEGEKGYGTPGSIDNTAATFGGVWFCRTDGAPIFEKKKLRDPINCLSRDTASTTTVVGDVRAKKKLMRPGLRGC